MSKVNLTDIDRYQDKSYVEKIRRKPIKDSEKKHKKTKREKYIDWDEVSE